MPNIQVRIAGHPYKMTGAYIEVQDAKDAFGVVQFLLKNYDDSNAGFQVDFYSGLKPLETFVIQNFPDYGVYIQYSFEEERPFYKSIGRAFVAFGTDDTESIHDPYTEWEQVYRYNYLPLEKAKEIIKDFYMNGLDAMANYSWDGSMPKQPGPG